MIAGRNSHIKSSSLGDQNLNQYSQAIGYPVDLECAVESFPLPSAIEWTMNGHRILDDSNYQISIQSDSHTVMSTRLRINSVQRRHFGTYVCSAGNKLGFSQSQVNLIESTNGPVCPPACPRAVYSDSINLRLSLLNSIFIISISFIFFKFKSF